MNEQDYQPRLLIPGAAGIPSHIRVSHDDRVYQEFADPAVTAVVCVPQWSQGVCDVFNQQAAARFSPQPEYSKQIQHRINSDAAEKALLDLLRAGTIEHLHHQLFGRTDSAVLINELAERQLEFIEAAAQQTKQPDFCVQFQVVDFMSDIIFSPHMYQPRDYTFDPRLPQLSHAHTDAHATGLFTHPVGTILVDHDGLDIKQLRNCDGGLVHAISVQHLANRLWQIPNASFALWRGEREGNAQYHFIPAGERSNRRARLFAFT